MPCVSYETPEEIHNNFSAQLDKLTNLLCEACSILYGEELLEGVASKELVEWHRQHVMTDKLALQREIEGLNPDELRKLTKFLDNL
jgi:hypothetical protein